MMKILSLILGSKITWIVIALAGVSIFVYRWDSQRMEAEFNRGFKEAESQFLKQKMADIETLNGKVDALNAASTEAAKRLSQLSTAINTSNSQILLSLKGKTLIDPKTCKFTDDFTKAWDQLRRAQP